MATATVLDPRLLNVPAFQTPADYVTLPSNYHPKPQRFVGLLSCQMDPLLRSLDSTIIRIEKKAVEAAPKGGKKKADKKAVEQPTGEEWEVELQDTVIFPEGGGQPCDYGTLTLKSSESQSAPVINAFRRNLDAIHVVRFPVGFDPSSNGWTAGAQVHIEVDWARRTYHMQQHTGQHVLSAVFEHELKNNTLGWQLSQSNQPSYVDLEKSPSDEDVAYVIRRCNQVIQAATRVRVEVKLEADHERPETLPEDYRDGVVRYITIDGLDVNPCCGTHHPNLAFLGSVFIFPGVTKVSGPTRHRINFVVGDAVLQQLASAHALVKDVSTALECGPTDVPERLSQLQKSRKDGLRREKVLKAEATRALVNELASSTREIGEVQVGHLHREEESTDMEFLTQILNAYQTSAAKWLLVLSSGPLNPGNGSGGCVLISGSDEGLVKKAGELVKTKFSGRVKGGGKGRWQGKLVGNWEKGDPALFGEILQEASV